MVGIPSQAKYGIFNDKGEQVYYAFEGDESINNSFLFLSNELLQNRIFANDCTVRKLVDLIYILSIIPIKSEEYYQQ